MTNFPTAERVLVLDTETTGLSAAARIVEIAAIEVEPRSGRLGSALHHLVNPLMPIPPAVTRIHGIRDGDVQGKPPFTAIAGDVAAFLRGATIAIQNARFDARILDAELERAGQPRLGQLDVRLVDTLDVSRGVFPLTQGHSLDRICDRLAVDRGGRTHHGALVDARLLAETLPKFAVEYDAWCAIADGECARELDVFDRGLRVILSETSGALDATSPEGAERALARVAGASSWVGRCEDWFRTCGAALVGADGWCCKHFVARWAARESVSWKAAASVHLAAEALDPFRAKSPMRVLTPLPDEETTARLDALQSAFDRSSVAASIACVVRGLVLLRAARKDLEAERRDLRDVLLRHVDDGYLLRHAALADGIRTSIDYKGAMAVLIHRVDLEPFTTRGQRLSVGLRDSASCEALFRSV